MFDPYDLTQSNVIYGLHAGDDIIRYVGLTTGSAEKRFRAHRSQADAGESTHKAKWMRSVGLKNIKCIVLQVIPEHEDIDAWEIVWIKQLSDMGYPLTNLTPGGRDSIGSNSGNNLYSIISRGLEIKPDRSSGKLEKGDIVNIWIMLKNGLPIPRIAELYKVAPITIRNILDLKSWRSIAPSDAMQIAKSYPKRSKLTNEQYLEIKYSKEPQLVLSDRYNVSQPLVSQIQNGKALRKGVDA